jgi:hypothetical protein
MSKFGKHIKKTFSDYEPDVNDLSLNDQWRKTEAMFQTNKSLYNYEPEVAEVYLDKKWNEIVPYLPDEKKRRTLLLLPTGCLMSATACMLSTLFLAVGFIITYDQHRLIDVSPTGKTADANSYINGASFIKKRKPGKLVFEPAKKGDRVTNKNNETPSNLKNDPNVLLYSPAVRTNSTTTSENTYAAANSRQKKPSLFSDSLYYLNSLSIKLYPPEVFLNPVLFKDSMNVKKMKHLTTDVTLGINNVVSWIMMNGTQTNLSNNTNFCLSAAVNYRLQKRFNLIGQMMFGNNTINYNTVNSTSLSIYRVPIAISTSVGNSDSSITYIPYYKMLSLRSAFNYQVGIGAEIDLLRLKKITVSASILCQLSISQFDYSRSYLSSGDTLTYVKQVSSPALTNEISSLPINESHIKVVKINGGGYLGINVRYPISKRVWAIIKPGYYVDLKDFKPEPFSAKQHRIFLTAGLRLTL